MPGDRRGIVEADTAAIRDGKLGRMMLNARAVVKAANTNAPLVVSGSPSSERLSDIFGLVQLGDLNSSTIDKQACACLLYAVAPYPLSK